MSNDGANDNNDSHKYREGSAKGYQAELTVNAERPNRGLDLNVAIAALRAGREPERTLGGIEDGLSAAAVGVVDELVEPHAGVWSHVQAGLVVKAQAGNASLVCADGLISMDAATNRERSGHAAVGGRRDAMVVPICC